MIPAAPPPAPQVVAAPAPAPAFVFAPPVDRPLLYRGEEVRDEGAGPRRFTVERRVRFRRDARGWSAEISLLRADADRDDGVARRFLTGARALDGVVLRYRLGLGGEVVAVEAEDAVWAAMLRGFAAASRGSPVPGMDLSGATPAVRRGMLDAPLRSTVATAAPAPGTRRVRLPGLGPAGGAGALEGTERTTRGADGLLTIETEAETGGGGAAAVRVRRVRTIDPATGLIRRTVEHRQSEAAGRTIRSVLTTSLTG